MLFWKWFLYNFSSIPGVHPAPQTKWSALESKILNIWISFSNGSYIWCFKISKLSLINCFNRERYFDHISIFEWVKIPNNLLKRIRILSWARPSLLVLPISLKGIAVLRPLSKLFGKTFYSHAGLKKMSAKVKAIYQCWMFVPLLLTKSQIKFSLSMKIMKKWHNSCNYNRIKCKEKLTELLLKQKIFMKIGKKRKLRSKVYLSQMKAI